MIVCIILIYSFGDGVQYPVQIKHFPGNIGHSTSNYESMGNSYSLNKFDPATPSTAIQIEPNDSQKNLLQASNGHDEGDINQPPYATARTISTVELND